MVSRLSFDLDYHSFRMPSTTQAQAQPAQPAYHSDAATAAAQAQAAEMSVVLCTAGCESLSRLVIAGQRLRCGNTEDTPWGQNRLDDSPNDD